MFQTLDDEAFERLEETLIYADVGAPTTAQIVERLEAEAGAGDLDERRGPDPPAARAAGRDRRVDGRHDRRSTPSPTVILMVGVNGTGKTTTIGKIAWHLARSWASSVLLAAGDTFRAAAAEQLETWAERAGVRVRARRRRAPTPGRGLDAIEAAEARGHDVVIVDTAGRLHTQDHLMEELRKVRR